MSRAVKMHRGLFGMIEQLVKVAGRGEHRLQHHAQREQAQQDGSKPRRATVGPIHRGILSSEGAVIQFYRAELMGIRILVWDDS
ncbi:MAG: hypothetical protein WA956_16025 [Stenotrophomonas sp.]